MQFTPGAAIDRKTYLEAKLTKIREASPKGTMFTQLRPGKYDYQVWFKVMKPNGSGTYERRDLSEIDPEGKAPKLNVKYPRPTEEFKGILEDCTRKSKETLQTIGIEE